MKTIYVVDGNEDDQVLLEMQLLPFLQGYRLVRVRDGLKAEELLQGIEVEGGSRLPEIIFINVNMPDGFGHCSNG